MSSLLDPRDELPDPPPSRPVPPDPIIEPFEPSLYAAPRIRKKSKQDCSDQKSEEPCTEKCSSPSDRKPEKSGEILIATPKYNVHTRENDIGPLGEPDFVYRQVQIASLTHTEGIEQYCPVKDSPKNTKDGRVADAEDNKKVKVIKNCSIM